MGSSVFHGAFSTFLAIVCLAPAKSFLFKVFYRLWFGIIVFSVANGFCLLPVLLSIFGNTESVVDHDSLESALDLSEDEKEEPKRND